MLCNFMINLTVWLKKLRKGYFWVCLLLIRKLCIFSSRSENPLRKPPTYPYFINKVDANRKLEMGEVFKKEVLSVFH